MELINKPIIELTRDEADAIADFTYVIDKLTTLDRDFDSDKIVRLMYDIRHQDVGVKADYDEFSFIITE